MRPMSYIFFGRQMLHDDESYRKTPASSPDLGGFIQTQAAKNPEVSCARGSLFCFLYTRWRRRIYTSAEGAKWNRRALTAAICLEIISDVNGGFRAKRRLWKGDDWYRNVYQGQMRRKFLRHPLSGRMSDMRGKSARKTAVLPNRALLTITTYFIRRYLLLMCWIHTCECAAYPGLAFQRLSYIFTASSLYLWLCYIGCWGPHFPPDRIASATGESRKKKNNYQFPTRKY